MRAIVHERYGSPDVLRLAEVKDPEVTDTGVLIRVHASSVNHSDWEGLTARPAYVRVAGNGFLRPKRPILGSDVAGTVVAVGGQVTGFRPGDEVIGDMLYHGAGCFAEYVVVPETAPLVHKPAGLSFEEAATLPQSGLLGLQGTHRPQIVQAGEHVLINGGGGGGGSFAIQFAKLAGAEVTAVDAPHKLELMTSLGADHVLDYTADSYTRHRGRYDRILDFTGHRFLLAKRRALASGGTYLAVGGSVPRLFETFVVGGVLSRVSDRHMSVLIAKPNKTDLSRLAELVVAGTVAPAIERRYTLEEVPEAVRRIGAGEVLGKVVVGV